MTASDGSPAPRSVAFVAAIEGTLRIFIEPWASTLDDWDVRYFAGEAADSSPLGCHEFGAIRRATPWRLLQSGRRLRQMLDADPPDVVFALTPFAIIAARIASVGRPWTVVCAAHGTLLEGTRAERTAFIVSELLTARIDDVTVALNDKDFAFYRKVRRSRPTVMAPAGGAGLDLERWTAVRQARTTTSDTADQVDVLYIGRRSLSKGLRLLEAAFRLARDSDPRLRLVVVGADSVGEPAWRPTDDEGVVIIDHTPDIDGYLSRAAVFCLCSPREGFPMALSEAALSGVPCVAVRNSGSTAVASRFPASVALCDADPSQLAAAILDAVARPTIDVAVDDAQSVSAANVATFYRELLDRRVPRRPA